MSTKEYIMHLIRALHRHKRVFISEVGLNYHKLKIGQIKAILEDSGLSIEIKQIENMYGVYSHGW